MVKVQYSDEFKRDAVAKITERGYPIAEVSKRLGPRSLGGKTPGILGENF